jgi:hypothetical protein
VSPARPDRCCLGADTQPARGGRYGIYLGGALAGYLIARYPHTVIIVGHDSLSA